MRRSRSSTRSPHRRKNPPLVAGDRVSLGHGRTGQVEQVNARGWALVAFGDGRVEWYPPQSLSPVKTNPSHAPQMRQNMNAAYSTTYRKGGKTYHVKQKNLDADTAWYVANKLPGAIRIQQPDGTWWVYAAEGVGHQNPRASVWEVINWKTGAVVWKGSARNGQSALKKAKVLAQDGYGTRKEAPAGFRYVRNPTEGVVARYNASDGETAQIVLRGGTYYVQFGYPGGPFSSGGHAATESAARKLIPTGFRKVRKNHWVLPVAVGAAVGAIAEHKYKLATKVMKAVDKRKNPQRRNGGGYEVIPHMHWKNVRTGATASIYGASPWTCQSEKDDWQRVTAGWTVRTPEGTVGIGRRPWSTREEAEAWVQKEHARLAEAERGRLAWLAAHPPADEKARRPVRRTGKAGGKRKNPALLPSWATKLHQDALKRASAKGYSYLWIGGDGYSSGTSKTREGAERAAARAANRSAREGGGPAMWTAVIAVPKSRENPAKHRRNHWLLPLAVGIPAGALLERKYKLTEKVVKNPAKKHRRNGEYGPDYQVDGKSGNYGVYLGGDIYSGRRIISGFKTRKDAEKAKGALIDARYAHSQGKHNNYFVNSRYGYSAVDYDAGKGERTAITGISRGMAQSMLFALQDANTGRHGERFGQ